MVSNSYSYNALCDTYLDMPYILRIPNVDSLTGGQPSFCGREMEGEIERRGEGKKVRRERGEEEKEWGMDGNRWGQKEGESCRER